jgi:hypothetical protein
MTQSAATVSTLSSERQIALPTARIKTLPGGPRGVGTRRGRNVGGCEDVTQADDGLACGRRIWWLLSASSLGYLAAGLMWMRTNTAFPFSPQYDPAVHPDATPVDRAAAAPWVTATAALGLAVTAGMRARLPGHILRRTVAAAAVSLGVVSLVLVPDGRGLVAAAHVPVLLVGKPFGWPPGVSISSQLPWPVVHQLVLMGVGGAWLIAALRYARSSRNACVWCGRACEQGSPARVCRLLTWGRMGVAVAVLSPAAYATSRIAWALDIPLGVTDRFLVDMRADEPTVFVGGAAMASLALGGALLTLGLVARWGERWPWWIPRWRGRAVRPLIAVVPSLIVAALLVSAGKGWHVSAARGELPESVFGPNWATVVFGATLIPWGLGLGLAAYCYWLRRRGPCRRCGLT